ncbi:peroxiredoxin family protein [Cryptosporangium minutisporangium]|uniref:Thioredoxin domain-containing protein n=1 Tax=Cryptosporangium minutisporangium TaxID=113569 RepID=A0ABP6SZU6_9ACTN
MELLAAIVAVLAVLVLVDLVLSAAIIRRLRQTETTLIELRTPPDTGLPVGATMPEFSAVNGDLSSRDLVGEPAVIAFFSTGCPHCPAQAERLAARADELAGHGTRVVSVLAVAEGTTDDLTPTLRKAGRLLTESGPDGLMAVFGETATPSFLLFDAEGRLMRKGHELSDVLGSG